MLAQANSLASEGQVGSGRPNHTDLRRAVSAAYYALFHALLEATTTPLLEAYDRRHREAFGRSIRHKQVHAAFIWIAGSGKRPAGVDFLVQEVRRSAELVLVAESYSELREERTKADYEHDATFAKADVLEWVRRARDAVGTLRRKQGSSELHAMAVLITLARQ